MESSNGGRAKSRSVIATLMQSLTKPSEPAEASRQKSALVIAGAFCTLFLAVGMQYAFSVVFRALLADTSLNGADRGLSAWVSSINSFCFVGFGLLAALSNQRQGTRITSLIGTVLSTVGFLASSYVSSVPALCLTYGVFCGVGGCFWNHSCVYAISTHFPQRRATALGMAMAGGGMGSLVLGPLLEYLIQTAGWRGALRVLACTAAVVGPIACLPFWQVQGAEGEGAGNHQAHLDVEAAAGVALGPVSTATTPDSASDEDTHKDKDSAKRDAEQPIAAATPAAGQQPEKVTIRSLLRYTPLMCFFAGISLYSGCFFSVVLHLVPFSSESPPQGPGFGPFEAASLVSYQGVANVIGRLLIGRLADMRGMDRRRLQQALLGCAGAALAGLSALPTSSAYVIVYAVLFGLCAGSIVATSPTIVAQLVPKHALALGLGLNSSVQAPLILLLPPVVGWAREALGGYAYVWGALSVLMVTGSVVMAPDSVMACCPSVRGAGRRDEDAAPVGAALQIAATAS